MICRANTGLVAADDNMGTANSTAWFSVDSVRVLDSHPVPMALKPSKAPGVKFNASFYMLGPEGGFVHRFGLKSSREGNHGCWPPTCRVVVAQQQAGNCEFDIIIILNLMQIISIIAIL